MVAVPGFVIDQQHAAIGKLIDAIQLNVDMHTGQFIGLSLLGALHAKWQSLCFHPQQRHDPLRAQFHFQCRQTLPMSGRGRDNLLSGALGNAAHYFLQVT